MPVGVKTQVAQGKLSVGPNPTTNGIVNIRLDKVQELTVVLMDPMGAMVKEINATRWGNRS